MNGWVKIETEGLPDFLEYGFHTGNMVWVRHAGGKEEVTIYQGYGLFGYGLNTFDDVTDWRPAKMSEIGDEDEV